MEKLTKNAIKWNLCGKRKLGIEFICLIRINSLKKTAFLYNEKDFLEYCTLHYAYDQSIEHSRKNRLLLKLKQEQETKCKLLLLEFQFEEK